MTATARSPTRHSMSGPFPHILTDRLEPAAEFYRTVFALDLDAGDAPSLRSRILWQHLQRRLVAFMGRLALQRDWRSVLHPHPSRPSARWGGWESTGRRFESCPARRVIPSQAPASLWGVLRLGVRLRH